MQKSVWITALFSFYTGKPQVRMLSADKNIEPRPATTAPIVAKKHSNCIVWIDWVFPWMMVWYRLPVQQVTFIWVISLSQSEMPLMLSCLPSISLGLHRHVFVTVSFDHIILHVWKRISWVNSGRNPVSTFVFLACSKCWRKGYSALLND